MASLPRVPNYLKNVTKSVLFAAADVGKDLAPDVAEFTRSNTEFVKQTYSSIRMPKMSARRRMMGFRNSKIFQSVEYGAKNILEDLRTGDFYNKAREDRDAARIAGFDVDLDDLSEFGLDADWDKDVDKSEVSITKGDLKVAGAIEKSTAASTKTTVEAIIATNKYSVDAARMNSAMLFEQNERLFSGLHNDISVVGATVQSIYKIQTSVLGNIDANLSRFQTESLRLDTERNNILKEMLEMQRNQYKTAQQKEQEAYKKKGQGRRFSDLTSDGILDFNAYIDHIKDNLNREISMYTMGMPIDQIISSFAMNPTREAMTSIMKRMVPGIIKSASKDLNNTIAGIFANALNTLEKNTDKTSILGQFVSRVLGVNTSVNRKINTGNYEKGQVPWDGISRRALTNVLPGYLRRIEAAITGEKEIDYDYNTGKWITLNGTSGELTKIKQQSARMATYDLIQGMNSTLNKNAPTGAKKNAEYQQAIDEFRQFLYDSNGHFYPNESAAHNKVNRNEYPMFYKYYTQIVKSYNEFDEVEKLDRDGNAIGKRHTKSGLRMRVAAEVMSTKDAEERRYRNLEVDGTSSISKLNEYTDKIKIDAKKSGGLPGVLGAKDKFGHTIHSYLHNINQELLFWRVNYGDGGFGGGSGASTGLRISFNRLTNALTTKEQKK